jgi:hypothetical protein
LEFDHCDLFGICDLNIVISPFVLLSSNPFTPTFSAKSHSPPLYLTSSFRSQVFVQIVQRKAAALAGDWWAIERM